MKVYLLQSNWKIKEGDIVSNVVGIYDCLAKAQKELVDNIYFDLESYPNIKLWANCTGDVSQYDFATLSKMEYDDKDFFFDAKGAFLTDDDYIRNCKVYRSYMIEEKVLY